MEQKLVADWLPPRPPKKNELLPALDEFSRLIRPKLHVHKKIEQKIVLSFEGRHIDLYIDDDEEFYVNGLRLGIGAGIARTLSLALAKKVSWHADGTPYVIPVAQNLILETLDDIENDMHRQIIASMLAHGYIKDWEISERIRASTDPLIKEKFGPLVFKSDNLLLEDLEQLYRRICERTL